MIILLLTVLGLVFGSFLTAFIDRVHDGRDWVSGRSECDSCNQTLGPVDLLPVISWVASKGRCRHCRKPVSASYPITETMTAVLLAGLYIFWPDNLAGFEWARLVLWIVMVIGFVGLSIYDIKWYLIPNRLLYPLIALALVFTGVEAVFAGGGTDLIRGAVLGILCCGGIFYVIFQVSGGKWIGGGDVKLGFLLGLLMADPYLALLVVMISSFIGILIALPAIIAKRIGAKSQLPYGPALMAATYIVFLWGEPLIDWYTTDLLYL